MTVAQRPLVSFSGAQRYVPAHRSVRPSGVVMLLDNDPDAPEDVVRGETAARGRRGRGRAARALRVDAARRAASSRAPAPAAPAPAGDGDEAMGDAAGDGDATAER